jgi:hypothetical protein
MTLLNIRLTQLQLRMQHLTELSLVSEVSANFFANRGSHVVSVTNPYGRILGFLDRSRYYSSK